MDYKKFRVKTPIKTFRDLEVYQKTVQLAHSVNQCVDDSELLTATEKIPSLIAEAYGDKYESKEKANEKLGQAITLIANAITRIDLLREKFKDNREKKEALDKLLTQYQRQKTKVLNLKRAWNRVYKK